MDRIPFGKSETHLCFEWSATLADVPGNTALTFSFRVHGEELAAE